MVADAVDFFAASTTFVIDLVVTMAWLLQLTPSIETSAVLSVVILSGSIINFSLQLVPSGLDNKIPDVVPDTEPAETSVPSAAITLYFPKTSVSTLSVVRVNVPEGKLVISYIADFMASLTGRVPVFEAAGVVVAGVVEVEVTSPRHAVSIHDKTETTISLLMKFIE
jgi:hypothetical protein